MTIDELKAIQAERGLGHLHVVEVREADFSIAHTDAERAVKLWTKLEDCELHRAMMALSGPPAKPGLYAVEPHQVDAYSESYRGDAIPWDFSPLEA